MLRQEATGRIEIRALLQLPFPAPPSSNGSHSSKDAKNGEGSATASGQAKGEIAKRTQLSSSISSRCIFCHAPPKPKAIRNAFSLNCWPPRPKRKSISRKVTMGTANKRAWDGRTFDVRRVRYARDVRHLDLSDQGRIGNHPPRRPGCRSVAIGRWVPRVYHRHLYYSIEGWTPSSLPAADRSAPSTLP